MVKKVSKKAYDVAKAMATMIKSSPYLSVKEKDKEIDAIIKRM